MLRHIKPLLTIAIAVFCVLNVSVAAAQKGKLRISGDNSWVAFVNGKKVVEGTDWQVPSVSEFSLKNGSAVIAVYVHDAEPGTSGRGGALIDIVLDDGRYFGSDANWKANAGPPLADRQDGWEQPEFDDSEWDRATQMEQFGGGIWGFAADKMRKVLKDPDCTAYWIWAGPNDGADDIYLRFTIPKTFITDRWCDFFGVVTIDGKPASIGTVIDAFDPQGVRCGTFIVNEVPGEGEYGFMHVYGDDDTTPDFDEGAEPGDIIRFSVDGMPAETAGPDEPIWKDMEHPRHVNLALEIVPGDVNGSGEATAFDASLVLQYVVGSISLSKSQRKAADVTGDDNVSALDAAWILQYTVGLITEFSIKSNPNAPIRDIQSEKELLADALVEIERLNLSTEQRAVVKQIKQLFFQHPPTQTALLPNYPNPFNPDTWLPYQLSEDAHVTIAIYNTKGQVVRILNLGEEKAGVYLTKDRAAYWNGRDNHGQKVTSGIYFYTLQVEPLNLAGNRTSKFIATRKMVIIK